MAKDASALDLLFSALGDPTRRAIVARLVSGPASVSELAAPHDMALPSFLGHLRKLEAAGLVTTKKTGRVRTCRIVPGALRPAQEWMSRQNENRPDRLKRLDTFVSMMKVDRAAGA
jgi:DNA-binding transcriptional ArsR family regulator